MTNDHPLNYPDRAGFKDLAASHRVVPVVRKVLADHDTALSAYRKLAGDRPGTFMLESAAHGQSWDRYSFIGTGARCALIAEGAGTDQARARWIGQPPQGVPVSADPLASLKEALRLLATAPMENLPPLSSGFVGYMGYDMIRYLEQLPDTCDNDLQIPDMVQLLVEDMAVVDHYEGSIWLIASVINWDGSDERVDEAYTNANARLDDLQARLSTPADSEGTTVARFDTPAPQYRRQRTLEEHKRRIELVKEHIRAGDAFQIVLSQRFEMDTEVPAIDIYRMLRVSNPSPYMFIINVPDETFTETAFQIVGSSPESLVKVVNGEVSTYPIAGSRPRGATVEQDTLYEKELINSEKENSEHLMLVDLGRNDLGRVARPGTVEVHDFRHVERYSAIMHLVSGVSARLAEDKVSLDAVSATFPAGTLSGAPKPSAMAIIDELEDTRRGIYGGTVGYFDFSGNTDQSIAIRSGLYKDGTVYVQAGGGIVADSDPDAEDEETRNKAAAVLRAVAAAETMEQL